MRELRGFEKRKLRALAHHLKPVIIIGKDGLTEAVTAAVDKALADHELIKCKFNEHKERKEELAERMADRTGSSVVSIIGNIVTLYRPHPDEQRRRVVL